MEPTRQSQTRFNVLDLRGRANRLEFAVFFIAWLIWLVARSFLDGPEDERMFLYVRHGQSNHAALPL